MDQEQELLVEAYREAGLQVRHYERLRLTYLAFSAVILVATITVYFAVAGMVTGIFLVFGLIGTFLTFITIEPISRALECKGMVTEQMIKDVKLRSVMTPPQPNADSPLFKFLPLDLIYYAIYSGAYLGLGTIYGIKESIPSITSGFSGGQYFSAVILLLFWIVLVALYAWFLSKLVPAVLRQYIGKKAAQPVFNDESAGPAATNNT